MTLTKQLWIVISVLITLTFISSFIVSGYTARNYFQEQLTVKNIDNANSLALSLSQMDKDPVTIKLLIAAQFDSGHYRRIELVDPNGRAIELREHSQLEPEVPSWFEELIAFDVPPGIAHVQDEWLQFGTLIVESQTTYALNALWRVFYQLLVWTVSIALVVGLIGSILLRRISQPLQAVVRQAEALGERRFITSKEPRTLEFMRLVRAMNTLTNRVRNILETEARRLDEIRRQSQLDPSTGVMNREQFYRVLSARLRLHDESAQDALLLLRITGLQFLNTKLGHQATDKWICALLERLRSALDGNSDAFSHYIMGRLNGSDFTILVKDTDFLEDLAISLRQAAMSLVEEEGLEAEPPLALVGCYFRPGEEHAHLMSRIDDLLATAEQEQTERLLIASEQQEEPLFPDANGWREGLEDAIKNNKVSYACYPVLTKRGAIYHEEAMLRVQLADQDVSAGAVIGWARRLGLLPQLDLQVLRSVLHSLSEYPEREMAVNLSVESVRQSTSFLDIIRLIDGQEELLTRRLSLEFNERVAVQYPGLLTSFSASVKSRGVKMGLQSAGRHLSAIAGLESMGLDYMKVDASLIQQQSKDVQSLLRGVCKMGHSLGVMMIAEGVLEDTDKAALSAFGFDAFTGPGAGS